MDARIVIAGSLALATSASSASAQDAQALLSDRCFACHGPDSAAREADLRLDTRSGLFGDRGGYAAVVPGDADASELLARVRAPGAERMPPIDSGLALSADEVETLRAWIDAGAPWESHWSFVAPGPTPLPDVADAAWVREPLDRFVLAALEGRGLEPAPPADPARLLRRVTLDLTGLPPTPAELDAFLVDPSDEAYRAVVERLLASPRYAERMAWEWLEAARYADTDGFQADPTRQMWPWRDWLVDALDRGVPFDQLTVEMLAGDLLPDATPEQVLATGFLRNNAHNGEGGRIAEETRVENVFDRVETTGTVWLGLTVGCARCHDHKFDPLRQREYFGLYDFFNQSSETGGGNDGRSAPVLAYRGADERERLGAVEAELAALERRELAPDPELDAARAAWEAALRASLRDDPAHAEATRLGPWRRTDALRTPDRDVRAAFDHAFAPERDGGADEPSWRDAPDLVDGEVYALPGDLGSTYLSRRMDVPSERTLVLSLGSDDAIRAWVDGVEVLANRVDRGAAPDQERVEIDVAPGEHELLFKVVNTGGAAGFYFRLAEERALGLDAELRAALRDPARGRSQELEDRLTRAHRAREAPWWDELLEQERRLRRELGRLRDAAPVVLVMDELPATDRRTTRVLERGGYDQPREAVEAHTPGFLPPLPDGARRDRLALARWLVSDEHPLTARVVANRAWQSLLGRGLVATQEDFGRQGGAPSHPALLDWLARELVASGWDVKGLHRSIVSSATYRQSASAAPAVFRDDPDNVWLARSSRPRLPAWMLRDQALALAGLLNEERGGPPVRPYQPEGVWAEATFGTIRYERDSGAALYRRSLYVFWRRIVGPTVFFDTAKRQTCSVRPSRTNSPLHALVTLNETAYVEAARRFAERAHEEADTDVERIAWAFRAATARAAEPDELDLLVRRLRASRATFDATPESAAALLAIGEAPADASIPPAELASFAVVCSVILNLDEVVTRP